MTALLQTRIESDIRDEAGAILAEQGMTMDDAVSRFLKRVIAERGLPLDLFDPNDETLQAIEQSHQGIGKTFGSATEMFAHFKSTQ